MRLGDFAARMNELLFFSPQWTVGKRPLAGSDASAGVFCNAKGQREIKITLAFLASHEACRRMAVYAMQAAGSRTRLASREAFRRAAVASRPTGISSTPLHACGAQSGVQGYYPCYSSTSTKKGWPQCSHTGLSSKSMSEARTITVWPQLGQSKDSS